MPPRLFSLAIILFWLTMTGLLLYRDIWPSYRPGEPPPYHIDLTEEVGANFVNWVVRLDGKRVGSGKSQVESVPDQTFRLRSEFTFDGLPITKLSMTEHITRDGRLLDLMYRAFARDGDVEVRGTVEGDELVLAPKAKMFGGAVPLPRELRTKAPGKVLNPMLALNRIPGLRLGRRWRVPLVNPLKDAGGMIGAVAGAATIPSLEAEVVPATLTWDKEDVSCFKIEYRPHNGAVTASTWARQRDGLVLRQDATHGAMKLVIERVPPR